MSQASGHIVHCTCHSGVGAFEFHLYRWMLTSKNLLRKIRRKDDHSIGITVFESRIHLVGVDIDCFQFVIAGQELIDKHVHLVTISTCRSDEGKSMYAASICQHQVEQRHDQYRHEKNQSQGALIAEHLLDNTAGESHNTREIHDISSWRLA